MLLRFRTLNKLVLFLNERSKVYKLTVMHVFVSRIILISHLFPSFCCYITPHATNLTHLLCFIHFYKRFHIIICSLVKGLVVYNICQVTNKYSRYGQIMESNEEHNDEWWTWESYWICQKSTINSIDELRQIEYG